MDRVRVLNTGPGGARGRPGHTVQAVLGLLLLLLLAYAPVARTQPAPPRVQTVAVPMSDGVRLSADLYLPAGSGTVPAVLVRTPYGRRNFAWLAGSLADAGYAVVFQDVRGQGDSEGEFFPLVHERRDGIETLDWIVRQPWSSGAVGMWGGSYLGFSALILAPERHPALRAIVHVSGWADTDELLYPGGALHLQLALPWLLTAQGSGAGTFDRIPWGEVFPGLPVRDIPSARLGASAPAWGALAERRSDPAMDREMNAGGRVGRISVPILHITGWNDFAARGTLRLFEQLAGSGDQSLLVGPWLHDQAWGTDTRVGDEDFGTVAALGQERVLRLTHDWFDRWLRGSRSTAAPHSRVRLFVMGANEWVESDRWPLPGTTVERWYLCSSTGANSASGDGSLARSSACRGRPWDEFLFDPARPVPTVGGANFHFFTATAGIRDQRPVADRPDVLVYTSPPLRDGVRIVGRVEAVVFAATSAPQTDFTAKLVVVRPDGYARIVQEGIRRGADPGHTPGRGGVGRYTIDLGYTAIEVPVGHRIRLEVSSSNFPKYDRNPNTGESAATAARLHPATQRVHHTPRLRSHLRLPVVRGPASDR